MNIIRKNFIVGLILIVIQLSITKALDDRNRITVNKIRKSKETDSNKLIKEIDSLINHVADCSESILKVEKQIISNPEVHSRRRRSNEPQKLDANVESKIKGLGSNVRSMKENVGVMKNGSNDSGTSERLDSLESVMDELQNLFDKKVKVIAAQMKNSTNFVHTLTKTLESLKNELDSVRQTFKDQQETPKFLKNKIIDDIKSRDFNSAASNLDKLTADLQKHVNFIVHEVYNNQANNFEIISLFANTTNLEKSLAIYKAVRFEMTNNGDNDYLKILRIIKSLKSKISDADESSIVPAVDKFINKLRKFVSIKLKTNLIDTLKYSDNSTHITETLENIRLKYPKFFSAFLERHLYDIIFKEGTIKLIKFFEDDNFSPSLNVWIYSAVFNLLNMTDSLLEEEAMVNLAFALKKAQRSPKIEMDSFIKGEKVTSSLPTSVKILAFGSYAICIKNKDYEEFLFTSYDINQKIRLFTWNQTKSRIVNSGWIIEPHGNAYRLKYFFDKSYSFMNWSNDVSISKDISNQNIGLDWVFLPKGEYVFIKNSEYNKYLFASPETIESQIRTVYPYYLESIVDSQGDPKKGSLWSIEECDLLDK